MGSFLALVIIILVALFLVKLGASALQLTGMSKPVSLFQASSAFFGVGFTTKEAEQVVNHPVRRKIILHLIIAGNIGLTSALATLLVTFMSSSEHGGLGMTFGWLAVIGVGVLALGFLLNLKVVRGPLDRVMRKTLEASGMRRVIDYDYLLNLRDGFCVYDGEIADDHPWIGRCLSELRPADLGVIVLGIYRSNGDFVGAPQKETVIEKKDVLMVYGRDDDVREALGTQGE
ncbi:MAG: TrkA C-terminal domain-containing protein [Akkermansiaceae bacterium]|nr:TrkA C-terminal domain-containing protein [Akkermansiaceae bacterium]